MQYCVQFWTDYGIWILDNHIPIGTVKMFKQNKNILPHAESKPFLPITLYWFMLRQAII